MPIDLRQIAAVSGMNGLYRVVKPTRTGVIIESLADKPNRLVAQARHRMSLLEEISIYTTDEETTVPLADVFDRIHEKYGDELPLSSKPNDDEYRSFMEEILPDYDQDRVYISDMKKLATWYKIVNKHLQFTKATPEAAPEETETAAAEKETTTKKDDSSKKEA
ncbi:DUF5606 domain-containing protein [Pontibacter sp. 13R65]|uniref:DUF5606 family protein n=1 Tax=Pontibacter sp. 13R65 TaxID=3127458 RepID=UPI00301D0C6D